MVICCGNKRKTGCTGSLVCLELPGHLFLVINSFMQYTSCALYKSLLYFCIMGFGIWKNAPIDCFSFEKEVFSLFCTFPEDLDAEGMKISWSIVSPSVIGLLPSFAGVMLCLLDFWSLEMNIFWMNWQNWSINHNANIWGFVSSDDKMSLQWALLDAHEQSLPPHADFCYNISLLYVPLL